MFYSEYVDPAVGELLTAGDPRVDQVIGEQALRLAAGGFAEDADRLVTAWQASTERPVTALAADPLRARAWAMLFDARGSKPGWAAALPPLDLDAEEKAHRAHLARPVEQLPAGGLLGDSTLGQVVSGLVNQLETGPADPVRAAVAEAEELARDGDSLAALELVRTTRAPAALVAGCRHLARLLAAGHNPLDADPDFTGALIAALHTRYPRAQERDWPSAVARVLDLTGDGRPGAAPGAISTAEARLGFALPADYRRFLLAADGLPADVTFPGLLPVAELTLAEGGVLPLSERGEAMLLLAPAGSGRIAVRTDPVLGTSTYPSFRALLEEHLRLLEG